MKILCPLCSSQFIHFYLGNFDTEKLSSVKYKYYKCTSCNVVFISPKPSLNELKKYYQKDYYGGSKLLEILQLERAFKIDKLKIKGKLLDYGCGEGVFLSIMRKKNFEVSGYDISPKVAVIAQKRYNLNVITPPSLVDKFPNGYFNLITIWHTLEHIFGPITLLNSLKKILADEGYLIISVPNISSLEARIGGGKWFHLDPPRHVCHYDIKSLGYLLKKSGLQIKKTDYFSLEYNFASLWQTLVNCFGGHPNFFYHILKRQPVENLSTKEIISSWLTTIFVGSIIIVPVLLLTFILPFFKQSGSLTVFVQKNETTKDFINQS